MSVVGLSSISSTNLRAHFLEQTERNDIMIDQEILNHPCFFSAALDHLEIKEQR